MPFVRCSVLCTMRQIGDGGGIDSPLVRSVGVWVRGGCAVFYAGFGRVLQGVGNCSKCQKKMVPNLAKIGFSKLAPAYGCCGNA